MKVARATITFNDKLATELLDVAAHFHAKLVAELAAASTAADVKLAAEFEERMCATQRECQKEARCEDH